MTNPVLAEVWRGGIVESQHRGAVCIVGPNGTTEFETGDTQRAIFPRSAIKIFQAIPLIESGAAGAYGFDNVALALACASHNGEPRHAQAASDMLAACKSSSETLECGVQKPMGPEALWELAASQAAPTSLHNNCSGKHAGMIATATHLGEDPSGYVKLEHPVQQRIRAVLAEMTDTTLDTVPCGIDGCSVPTWAFPLRNMALGMSRLVTGEGPGAAHKSAADRLIAACTAEPEMTSGAGRRCGAIMQATQGRAYVKVGAEGVYCAAIPERGLGIALKIDDGTTRAAESAISQIVSTLLPHAADALAPLRHATLKNWRDLEVGTIKSSSNFTTSLAGVR